MSSIRGLSATPEEQNGTQVDRRNTALRMDGGVHRLYKCQATRGSAHGASVPPLKPSLGFSFTMHWESLKNRLLTDVVVRRDRQIYEFKAGLV